MIYYIVVIKDFHKLKSGLRVVFHRILNLIYQLLRLEVSIFHVLKELICIF